MKQYRFTAGGWDSSEFIYAASAKIPYRKPFLQEADHILGAYNREAGDYDYISMVTREQFGSGTVIETTCAFEGSGAPLIVLGNELNTLENGSVQYGTHFEVVLYKGGCNIWYIPLVNGMAKAQNVIRLKTPIAEGKPARLRVEIVGKVFKVSADGHEFEVTCEHLPDHFQVGITACEGICRFYDLTIR